MEESRIQTVEKIIQIEFSINLSLFCLKNPIKSVFLLLKTKTDNYGRDFCVALISRDKHV